MQSLFSYSKKFTTVSASKYLLLVVLLVVWSSPTLAAQLRSIGTISTADSSQVVLQLDGNVRFSAHTLSANGDYPARCYVDLYSTLPDSSLERSVKVTDTRLTAVRIGIHGTSTRVVVDLLPGHICSVTADSHQQRITMRCQAEPGAKQSVATNATGSIALNQVSQNSATPLASAISCGNCAQGREAEVNKGSNLNTAAPHEQSFAVFADDNSSKDLLAIGSVANKSLTGGGRILGFAASDLHHQNNEDTHLLRLRSRLWLQHEKSVYDDIMVLGRGSVEWDILDTDDKYAARDNDLKLYEGYIKLSGDSWDLSVGQQRVRWGKSDQLSPLDSINPDDLRQFMTVDLEERKRPSPLARMRLYGEKFTLETIVMPWFKESELDYFDSDWALYRNLRETITSNGQLPQFIRDYAANLHVHEKKPANSLENMSGAVRLAWQTDSSDFAVSYRYGWETLPTITSFPVKNINFSGDPHSNPTEFMATPILTAENIQACFKRQKIVGFEWESVFDPVGFRGEIAYLDHVSLLSSDLTSISKRAAHLVAGVDYTTVDDWYFNVQTSWYRIFDFDERILYFNQNNVALLGEVRKTLWRGNLELSTRYNYTLSDGSSYVQPAVNLKYFTNVECELGVMLFSGGATTLLGSYDDADQLYLQMKFIF